MQFVTLPIHVVPLHVRYHVSWVWLQRTTRRSSNRSIQACGGDLTSGHPIAGCTWQQHANAQLVKLISHFHRIISIHQPKTTDIDFNAPFNSPGTKHISTSAAHLGQDSWRASGVWNFNHKRSKDGWKIVQLIAKVMSNKLISFNILYYGLHKSFNISFHIHSASLDALKNSTKLMLTLRPYS